MPGHLIAVLVVLGLQVYQPFTLVIFPFLMLLALFGLPLEVTVVLGVLTLFAQFGWYAGLMYGLGTRRAWAPRWTRITAATLCVGGGVSVMAAFAGEAAAEDLVVVAVLQLGVGGSLLWAVGRADVRAWIAGADGPIDRV